VWRSHRNINTNAKHNLNTQEIYKKNTYLGGENKTRKSIKLITKQLSKYKEIFKKDLNYANLLSRSSKFQSFLSLQRHHLPHDSTMRATTIDQQANKSTPQLGITQDRPKQLKKAFHKVQATSQWRRRWSTNSPFFLHIQHLSTTITFHFLRLSVVKIFPRAAD
jgi:hypothetical protein